jgi:anti-sigma B factor antagonist
VETAVGVFTSRERAEEAVRNLVEKKVPEESIVFLTLVDSETATMGKELGAFAGGFVGGATGLSAGVAAATLLAVPGIGQVIALGLGATALLGLVGAGTGAAVGKKAGYDADAPAPTAGTGSLGDSEFFRKVLSEKRSLVIVRTESAETARSACEVLDRIGISMKDEPGGKSEVTKRESGGLAVIHVSGRIALNEGTATLRDAIHASLGNGSTRILLNLGGVQYMDSAGIGELVRSLTSVRRSGGQMRLVSPSKNVLEMLKTTKLDRVFEIDTNETAATRAVGLG